MGPIHAELVQRPVAAKEALTAMGFVVYPSLAEECGLDILLPDWLLNSPRVRGMTGNAMHLATTSIVTTIALACVAEVFDAEHMSSTQSEDHVADGLVEAFKAYIKKT